MGSLGGQTNACLLETSADEIAKEAVAWDTQPRLQFAVPFVDMKPNINLGKNTHGAIWFIGVKNLFKKKKKTLDFVQFYIKFNQLEFQHVQAAVFFWGGGGGKK